MADSIYVAISHRIFDDVEHATYTNARRYHSVPMTIERFLDLDLLDLSIVLNGMSLYHLLMYHNQENSLKLLIQSNQCDWSIFKDNTNQVQYM